MDGIQNQIASTQMHCVSFIHTERKCDVMLCLRLVVVEHVQREIQIKVGDILIINNMVC